MNKPSDTTHYIKKLELEIQYLKDENLRLDVENEYLKLEKKRLILQKNIDKKPLMARL